MQDSFYFFSLCHCINLFSGLEFAEKYDLANVFIRNKWTVQMNVDKARILEFWLIP